MSGGVPFNTCFGIASALSLFGETKTQDGDEYGIYRSFRKIDPSKFGITESEAQKNRMPNEPLMDETTVIKFKTPSQSIIDKARIIGERLFPGNWRVLGAANDRFEFPVTGVPLSNIVLDDAGAEESVNRAIMGWGTLRGAMGDLVLLHSSGRPLYNDLSPDKLQILYDAQQNQGHIVSLFGFRTLDDGSADIDHSHTDVVDVAKYLKSFLQGTDTKASFSRPKTDDRSSEEGGDTSGESGGGESGGEGGGGGEGGEGDGGGGGEGGGEGEGGPPPPPPPPPPAMGANGQSIIPVIDGETKNGDFVDLGIKPIMNTRDMIYLNRKNYTPPITVEGQEIDATSESELVKELRLIGASRRPGADSGAGGGAGEGTQPAEQAPPAKTMMTAQDRITMSLVFRTVLGKPETELMTAFVQRNIDNAKLKALVHQFWRSLLMSRFKESMSHAVLDLSSSRNIVSIFKNYFKNVLSKSGFTDPIEYTDPYDWLMITIYNAYPYREYSLALKEGEIQQTAFMDKFVSVLTDMNDIPESIKIDFSRTLGFMNEWLLTDDDIRAFYGFSLQFMSRLTDRIPVSVSIADIAKLFASKTKAKALFREIETRAPGLMERIFSPAHIVHLDAMIAELEQYATSVEVKIGVTEERTTAIPKTIIDAEKRLNSIKDHFRKLFDADNDPDKESYNVLAAYNVFHASLASFIGNDPDVIDMTAHKNSITRVLVSLYRGLNIPVALKARNDPVAEKKLEDYYKDPRIALQVYKLPVYENYKVFKSSLVSLSRAGALFSDASSDADAGTHWEDVDELMATLDEIIAAPNPRFSWDWYSHIFSRSQPQAHPPMSEEELIRQLMNDRKCVHCRMAAEAARRVTAERLRLELQVRLAPSAGFPERSLEPAPAPAQNVSQETRDRLHARLQALMIEAVREREGDYLHIELAGTTLVDWRSPRETRSNMFSFTKSVVGCAIARAVMQRKLNVTMSAARILEAMGLDPDKFEGPGLVHYANHVSGLISGYGPKGGDVGFMDVATLIAFKDTNSAQDVVRKGTERGVAWTGKPAPFCYDNYGSQIASMIYEWLMRRKQLRGHKDDEAKFARSAHELFFVRDECLRDFLRGNPEIIWPVCGGMGLAQFSSGFSGIWMTGDEMVTFARDMIAEREKADLLRFIRGTNDLVRNPHIVRASSRNVTPGEDAHAFIVYSYSFGWWLLGGETPPAPHGASPQTPPAPAEGKVISPRALPRNAPAACMIGMLGQMVMIEPDTGLIAVRKHVAEAKELAKPRNKHDTFFLHADAFVHAWLEVDRARDAERAYGAVEDFAAFLIDITHEYK